MVVLGVTQSFGRGGLAENVGFTVRTLVASGHKVTILTNKKDQSTELLVNSGARLLRTLLPYGLPTTVYNELPSPWWRRAFIYLSCPVRILLGMAATAVCILIVRPDVLLVAEIVFPQCAIVGRLFRVPTICQVQAELRQRRDIRRMLICKLISQCDRIVGITRIHIEPFAHLGPTAVSVIPNSVSVSESYNPEALIRKQFSISSGKRIITYVGGATYRKAHLFVLQVHEALLRKRNDTVLIFAGHFNKSYSSQHAPGTSNAVYAETKEVFDFVAESGISEHVRLVGERSDIESIINASDLLLVPNRVPHFSRPVLEAHACKTPVIASDDVFHREVLSHGDSGLLAPYGDIPPWIEGIEHILDDPAFANRLATGGSAVFAKDYAPAVVASKLLQMFEDLAGSIDASKLGENK